MNSKPIPIIINPSSGKPQPFLHTINKIFCAHQLSWVGHLIYQFGDATRFAQQWVLGVDYALLWGLWAGSWVTSRRLDL